MINNVTFQTRHFKEYSSEDREKDPNLVAEMSVIEYPPVCFTIKKLRKCKYIEFSYFMPEGRAKATRNKSISSSEIFTLTKENDMLSLKAVINFKKSKEKAIQNKDLS